jgi:hypothetical protein
MTLMTALAVILVGLVALDQGYITKDVDEKPASRRNAPVTQVTEKSPVAAVATAAEPDAVVASTAVAPVSAGGAKSWQQLAAQYGELKGYLDAKDDIARAYALVSGPYAEAIATYSATYPAGNRPGENLDRFIRQHLSSRLRLVNLKIMPPTPSGQGRYVSTANISLLAADSQAMAQAILDLGNPDNGLLWRELTVIADAAKKTLRVDGQLALTLIESAE